MKPRVLIAIVSGVIPLLAIVVAAAVFFLRNNVNPQQSGSPVPSASPTPTTLYKNIR